ncbi:DUF4432 family protein [Novosphingobium sp. BL-52-GroH]|uniref:DUF4432 family protein n=1 Tax=Novosphingobium sp. BL-52-GroH TaxID=3349877 RepID=UPI00384FF092
MNDYGRAWLARHGRHGGAGHGATLLQGLDGAARGTRVLDLVAGPDLSVRIAVDRGFEISEITSRGVAVGWASPGHLRSPALHEHAEDDQCGFLRSFSGALATCGLDHFGKTSRESAAGFGYPVRPEVVHPMHGRAAFLPATLRGYGIAETAAGRVVWAEGEQVQHMVFGEHLALIRRIELPLFGSALRVADRVENRGSRPTPHGLLYHWNFGWPLLAEGTRIAIPGATPMTASGPVDGYGEQVQSYDPAAGMDGGVAVTVRNPELGLAAVLRYRAEQLPVLYKWQAFEPGIYALGIEPATQHADLPMAMLGAGEVRGYDQSLTLDWSV